MAMDYFPNSDSPAKETENKTRKDIIYKTKKIQFLGRTKRIILQNENGPCPLIAICNVLLLRNDMNLYPDIFEVSQESLLTRVAERLIEFNSAVDSQLQKISEAIDRLPCLADGINVDIKFRRIDDFEFSPELAIFDLLKIPLYHGWIVDPQDFETVIAIGCKSYNALTTELVALETHTVKARSGKNSGECCVDFSAENTAALGVPSQRCSKRRSFAHSPPPYAEHIRLAKGDIEEEIVLLRALRLSEKEALGFDTHKYSSSEEECVSASSEDAEACCTSTFGSNICQESKSHQFSSMESEDDMDCDVGNKINVGEDVRSITSTTKRSGALDHDQLSSTGLGDETVFDIETEKSSKMTAVHVTSSEAIFVEKTNLESTKNGSSSEIPLKSDASNVVNQDLSDRSQDDDVSLGYPVYEGESLVENGLTPEEGEVIRKFLNGNASQLTFPGLFFLQQSLKECELCVFFRNNHFSTMLKYDNELYVLVTDQGYQIQQELVWEKLNEVNGDSVFITGDFKVFKSVSSQSRKWDEQKADYIFSIKSLSKEGMEIDPDLKMAMELQKKELDEESYSEVL